MPTPPETSPSPVRWDFFLAHAHADAAMARRLYELLQPYARAFLDAACLKLGDDWDTEIARAQRESWVTVVLVSSRTAKAYYQREEVAAAIQQARQNPDSHRVVPIYLSLADQDTATVYGLRLKQGLTLSETLSIEDAAQKLRELLGQLGVGTPATGPAPNLPPGTDTRGLWHAPPASWVAPIATNRWRYKAIAFDVDGTLLRGPDFEFSWSRIWAALNVSKAVQNELRREYRRRAEADPSRAARIAAYQKWCEEAVGHFKRRGLTRDRIRQITTPLELTQNCRDSLRKLRENGLVVVLVSGGIQTFLEDRFPDVRDYADYIFINQLTFAPDGALQGIHPSSYDFEGKAEALDLVCQHVGCTADETVFVGDHFNDEAIMLRAKLSIAYPPQDSVSEGVASVSIREDDLSLILPHVFVE